MRSNEYGVISGLSVGAGGLSLLYVTNAYLRLAMAIICLLVAAASLTMWIISQTSDRDEEE
jgi:hypothetical protein